MRFGVSWNTAHLGIDPDEMVGVARHAEALGFESFFVNEHVATYPGASIGPMPLPADLPFADPLECLTFVAAATRSILLGTAVLLVPYHHPVTLAKRLATVDVLSKGRMQLLTVGLGGLPGEAAAVGVDYRSRGRRADEAIDVLRLLWTSGVDGVSHHGEFFDLDSVCSYPKPHGGKELPIRIGGSSRAAARRAGLRGDGYFPGGRLSLVERAEQLELMRSVAAEAGRDPSALDYTRHGTIDMSESDVDDRARQGVTRLVVSPTAADPGDRLGELEEFAQRHSLTSPETVAHHAGQEQSGMLGNLLS